MLYIYIYLAIGMLFIGTGMLIMGDDFDKEMNEVLGVYADEPLVKELLIVYMIFMWGFVVSFRIYEALFGEQK